MKKRISIFTAILLLTVTIQQMMPVQLWADDYETSNQFENVNETDNSESSVTLKGITLETTELVIYVNDIVDVKIFPDPYNARIKFYGYADTDDYKADVGTVPEQNSLRITGLKAGTTTIHVKAYDETAKPWEKYDVFSAELKVTVIERPLVGITTDITELSLSSGESADIRVLPIPSDSTEKIQWISSDIEGNPSVAMVKADRTNATLHIIGKTAGTVRVIVYLDGNDGNPLFSTSINLTVYGGQSIYEDEEEYEDRESDYVETEEIGFDEDDFGFDDDTDYGSSSQKIEVSMPVTKHTVKEIRSFIKRNGVTTKVKTKYKKKPKISAPYAAGELADSTKRSAIKMLNNIRYIAGLDANVKLDQSYCELVQAALINAVNGQLSHSSSKPKNMSENLYKLCAKGASSCNLGMGYDNLNAALVYG